MDTDIQKHNRKLNWELQVMPNVIGQVIWISHTMQLTDKQIVYSPPKLLIEIRGGLFLHERNGEINKKKSKRRRAAWLFFF